MNNPPAFTPLIAPTAQQIEDARTDKGGWSRAVLDSWGVPWPPPKGWRKRLEERARGLNVEVRS